MRAIDRAEAAMTLQLRERALLEGERQKPVDVTGPQANRFELLACEVLLLDRARRSTTVVPSVTRTCTSPPGTGSRLKTPVTNF
jgi:hypothetical protein